MLAAISFSLFIRNNAALRRIPSNLSLPPRTFFSSQTDGFSETIFDKILRREILAKVLFEDDKVSLQQASKIIVKIILYEYNQVPRIRWRYSSSSSTHPPHPKDPWWPHSTTEGNLKLFIQQPIHQTKERTDYLDMILHQLQFQRPRRNIRRYWVIYSTPSRR